MMKDRILASNEADAIDAELAAIDKKVISVLEEQDCYGEQRMYDLSYRRLELLKARRELDSNKGQFCIYEKMLTPIGLGSSPDEERKKILSEADMQGLTEAYNGIRAALISAEEKIQLLETEVDRRRSLSCNRWDRMEEAFSALSGDLNHNNVAKAKEILRKELKGG